jgi:septal ring factor EnvC (AmiA/AmiB activator)
MEHVKMDIERNKKFLNWIADRLVYVYKESENVDFVLRLRELANEIQKLEIKSKAQSDDLKAYQSQIKQLQTEQKDICDQLDDLALEYIQIANLNFKLKNVLTKIIDHHDHILACKYCRKAMTMLKQIGDT